MKKMFLAIPLTSLSIAVMAQTSLRDTTAVAEVIISENRLQIPFNKRIRNIQIIQKEEIAKLPAHSINEVLSYIPGVDVRQRGPFGTQADISIDGGSFEQTLILINGVKVSDIQTGHHSMNIPVSLDAVERIEVLRGPAARVYGINALTGAINIVTKTSEKTDLSVRIQGGSSFMDKEEGDGSGIYGGFGTQVVGNLATGKVQSLFSLGGNKSNGQRYNSKTEDVRAFYQGKMQVNDNNGVELTAGYIHNAFGANGFYAPPSDRESFEVVNTGILSLGSRHRLSRDFELSSRLSYRGNTDDYRYFRNDLSKSRFEHETNVYAAELNTVFNRSFGDFGFGLESRRENIESNTLGKHLRYNHGVYMEYKADIMDRFLLNIGTYINYNTEYGWQAFPGLDLGYAINNHLKATFVVGSSQRIPSYTDLYVKNPSIIGNPNLQSEEAWQYEFGLRYEKGDKYFRAGYFYRDISDFIDWIREDESALYQSFNFGNNKINGLNIGIGQMLQISEKQRVKYDLSYNYLKPKDMEYSGNVTSKYIVESLKHQAIARVVYQVSKVDVTIGGRWVERELNDPYLIADMRLGYNMLNWNFYFEGNNIFNESYKEVAAVNLPKRWYTVGLKYNLK